MENKNKPQSFSLNRREHIRYFVKEYSAGDIGRIMEMSSSGMRIRKADVQDIKGPSLIITLFNTEIKADIVWQDKYFMGLKCVYGFDVASLIKKVAVNLRNYEFRTSKPVTDDAISEITGQDVFSACLNLIEELEGPDIDMNKLTKCIEALSEPLMETTGDEEAGPETGGDIKDAGPSGLGGLLIREALRVSSARSVDVTTIDFAVARLGLEAVKKISRSFVREKLADLDIPLSGFTNYASFIILKTVFFRRLSHFFGFEDEESEGRLLLSLETKGIEILMDLRSADSNDLKHYYTSSTRVYSEISRIIERNNFGRDILLINKSYFENRLGMFEDLYDGYVLAHLVLNPSYMPDNIKLTLTKQKLVYAFLVYLTFIATEFILDRDREGAISCIHMLKRAGMNEDKIKDFLDAAATESNQVLGNLGLKGNIRTGTLPHTPFKIDGYLHKGIHFKYLLKAFDDFSTLKSVRRIAVRYEDESYAHFILGKFMIAEDTGLNSKAFCVIPCRNISEQEMYLEEFALFDIIILKDVDSLERSQLRAFMKLWDSFEGKIIVTFSSGSFLDFDRRDLYLLLKDHIVDFPSYFADRRIYERMIDHTIDQLKPFIGGREIDRNRYAGNICSMAYIKGNELRSYS